MTKTIEEIKEKLNPIFKKRQVALAYLFGSHARGRVTALSDVDVAVVFADNVPRREYFDRELELMSDIGDVFRADRVDIINLETNKSPLLKHRAVFYGKPLFIKDEKRRFSLEHGIMRAYEDTEHIRKTQFQAMRTHLVNRTFGKPKIYVAAR